MSRIDRNEVMDHNPELNDYRLVTHADLQPHALLYMVHILPHDRKPSKAPMPIRLSAEPVKRLEGSFYVFYESEDEKTQGTVSHAQFVGQLVDADSGPYLTTLYLVHRPATS